jgi:hypothetical protein
MRYVVKGSKNQWEKALEGQHLPHDEIGTVQIQATREKRKALEAEDIEREAANDKGAPSPRGSKKKSKSSTKSKKR